jgi:hypothetical protein
VLHGLPSSVHAVPDGRFASAGQLGPFPGQTSSASHSSTAPRQTVVVGSKASAGQTVLVPVQFSATSQAPAAARHSAPALPAGCWQLLLTPLHWSRLQGLPSELHSVPEGCFASAVQSGPFPGQKSSRSHSPAAPRQSTVAGSNASAGQVVLVPVQLSATSQTPAVARQIAPALPAGCWQPLFVPSHSSVLHGLPSSVHVVPLGCLASAEQSGPFPGQKSSRSHSPPEGRQSVDVGSNASPGQTVLVPVHVSAMSQAPAEARHVAPAFPAGC